MEFPGGQTSIDVLRNFLEKNGDDLHSTSMDLVDFFPSLKFSWETNLAQLKPKMLNEFLETSQYNATARRIGLRHQAKDPRSGQPSLPIETDPTEVNDGFHIEIYSWQKKSNTEPEPDANLILSNLEIFTGIATRNSERLPKYIERLVSTDRATRNESERDSKKTTRLTFPLSGIPDFKVQYEGESKKRSGKFDLEEVSLDIVVPYETIGNWLEPKQN